MVGARVFEATEDDIVADSASDLGTGACFPVDSSDNTIRLSQCCTKKIQGEIF